jgi:DNA helicase-2/ATP-dependent DNA helicase PcrA
LIFYKKLSAAAYQSESEIVEQFELALRLLANPRDQLHLGILSKAWGAQLPEADLQAGPRRNDPVSVLRTLAQTAQKGCAQAVMDAIATMQWTGDDFRFLGALTTIEQFADNLPDDDRALVLQDTREWRKHWDYYIRSEAGGHHSITSFLGQVALGTTQRPKDDGLALLTVHSAKGMEFDVVFLIGMTEGTFPDYRAKGRSLAEEGRSAFVAVTRSKRLLYITYPKTRVMPWGAIRTQQPSRYVSAIFGGGD